MTVPVGALGATGVFEHAGALGNESVRRLACDASITRVVLGPRSEPLDVGRKTPVVSPAIRRAVITRDRLADSLDAIVRSRGATLIM